MLLQVVLDLKKGFAEYINYAAVLVTGAAACLAPLAIVQGAVFSLVHISGVAQGNACLLTLR